MLFKYRIYPISNIHYTFLGELNTNIAWLGVDNHVIYFCNIKHGDLEMRI